MPQLLKWVEDSILTILGIIYCFLFSTRRQYRDPKILDRYKYKKLKVLLIEANKNVPYYKDLFARIGFEPLSDFKSLEDLQKIPTLPKSLVKQDPSLFINKRMKRGFIYLKTSGSTGIPLEVRISYKAWIVEQAMIWRNWGWSGYGFRSKMTFIRSFVPKNKILFRKDKIRNFIYFSPFHLTEENCLAYARKMKEEKVKFLRGYPSSIQTFAENIRKHNISIPTLKGVFVASERLTEKGRAIIEKAFGIPVSNHYGLADVCVMMGDCERHQGLHNYEDYGHLELLEYEGKAHKKRIVGTHLHNKAMPLIRYETGDIAELSTGDCPCDRSFPTIKNIIGRHDAAIVLSDGTKVPTVNFYTMFDKYLDIDRWQLVQKRHNVFEVYLKMAPAAYEKIVEDMDLELKKRLAQNVEISYLLNQPFKQVYEGKINPFISEIT